MAREKSPQARKRQGVTAFARKVGLPPVFLDLDISGLELLVDNREISEANKTLILRFLSHISPEVSERRLTFYTHKLRKLACWLKKDFPDVQEDDLRSLLTFLGAGRAREDGEKYSKGTLHGYKVTLKRFYRWLEGRDDEYPPKVRWIKTNGDATRIHTPEQLLTFEEVLEMIRHARNPRDKAMISFLYESGARISEMLSMEIRHVEFTPTLVKAILPISKTVPRVIPLVSCKAHLTTWLNYHPHKNNQEVPLWSDCKGDGKSSLRNSTVSDILKKAALDAGINKRVYPHLFRACSITHKQAAGWPEQAIKMFHGLSKDSKVMKHYSHLSYNNLEQIQRRMHGLRVEDSPDVHRGIKCPRCGKLNPLFVETCECGLPTEMRVSSGSGRPMEAEIEARLEKKMREFVEERLAYDGFMDRFMDALLEKCRQSPLLLKTVGDIRVDFEDRRDLPPIPAARDGKHYDIHS